MLLLDVCIILYNDRFLKSFFQFCDYLFLIFFYVHVDCCFNCFYKRCCLKNRFIRVHFMKFFVSFYNHFSICDFFCRYVCFFVVFNINVNKNSLKIDNYLIISQPFN